MSGITNHDDYRACVPGQNYGARVLRELTEEVKNMTVEDYDKLYESCKDADEVHLVFPEFDDGGNVIGIRRPGSEQVYSTNTDRLIREGDDESL